jgi:FkbM family methyltransferase
MLSVLLSDAKFRKWLASLENPTRTRHRFRIFTIAGDLTSDWIKLYGQHEGGPETFILDNLRTGSTFLDIGANVGYFSLLAAVKCKVKVVAFEPQSPIAALLLNSVAFNKLQKLVKVEQIALSDTQATMRMTSCPTNTGHSQLANTDDKNGQSYLVSVVALDDWVKENPLGPVSVCKIDTEGAELRVLRGMSQLLDRDSPAVVIEIFEECLAEFGASGSEIFSFFNSHGYTDVSEKYVSRDDNNRYFIKIRGV